MLIMVIIGIHRLIGGIVTKILGDHREHDAVT